MEASESGLRGHMIQKSTEPLPPPNPPAPGNTVLPCRVGRVEALGFPSRHTLHPGLSLGEAWSPWL